ncbi:MAG: hypothetical protein DMF91_19220 [Acidobacteria bacterium]|nr:MAG: hypothetical protein DMF91_19220 [Acidobacteriota bacterium]
MLANDEIPGGLIALQAALNESLDGVWLICRHEGVERVSIRYTAVIGFARHHDELACDNVPLSAIAEAEGTPVYVYSAAAFRARYRAIDAAFGDYPHALHYALKANSALAIARLMRDLGSAADANSIWEIELARKAGFQPAQIVFTGVGKSAAELECAVPLGLKAINVESAGELARIARRRPDQP